MSFQLIILEVSSWRLFQCRQTPTLYIFWLISQAFPCRRTMQTNYDWLGQELGAISHQAYAFDCFWSYSPSGLLLLAMVVRLTPDPTPPGHLSSFAFPSVPRLCFRPLQWQFQLLCFSFAGSLVQRTPPGSPLLGFHWGGIFRRQKTHTWAWNLLLATLPAPILICFSI